LFRFAEWLCSTTSFREPELFPFYSSTISLGPVFVSIQFSKWEREQEGAIYLKALAWKWHTPLLFMFH
jgi:hypothetical protein